MSERFTVFLNNLAGGGAERAMLHLARGMADRGHKVDLVLAKAEGPYLANVPSSVRVIDYNVPQARSALGQLTKYLETEKPKGMVSALDAPNVVAIMARNKTGRKVNHAISIQNTLGVQYRAMKDFRKRLQGLLVKSYYPKAQHIVSVSNGVATDLADWLKLPMSRMTVINNAIVFPELLETAQKEVTHPWLQPGQPPVIVAVGRLHQQKNYPMLLKAFRILLDKGVDARLLILGQGDLRPELEAIRDQLQLGEKAALPGFVDNPFAHVARSRIFAMSSDWEGLPTVLVEALAVGTPVVTTDCPSGPFEITENGKYGTLTPLNDPQAFADALHKELQRERISPDPICVQSYRIEVIAEQFENLLMKS